MIEKIEKIARVQRVDNDVGKRFDERRQSGNKSFLEELHQAMDKKNPRKPAKISDAYSLELTSTGTQSLFYYAGLDLEALLPTR